MQSSMMCKYACHLPRAYSLGPCFISTFYFCASCSTFLRLCFLLLLLASGSVGRCAAVACSQGCAILSGDTLVVSLCAALRPQRAVFLTDVPGVYDRPPDQPGARLLHSITVDHRGEIVRCADQRKASTGSVALPATSVAAHDVTGGLGAKLKAAGACAAMGVPVFIVQVGTAHAEAALNGEWPAVCTVIERAG